MKIRNRQKAKEHLRPVSRGPQHRTTNGSEGDPAFLNCSRAYYAGMVSRIPPEALTFFRSLARNNNRDWFQPRKELFETKVKAPMVELVESLNAEFAKFAPEYINDPKKAARLPHRIYRDTRFSSDKTPYKTHLAAIFPKRGTRIQTRRAGVLLRRLPSIH